MKKTLAVALVALTGTLMAGSFTPDRATDTTIKTNAFNATYVTILAPYTNGVGITLQEFLDNVIAGPTQHFHYGIFHNGLLVSNGLVVRGGINTDTITGGTGTFHTLNVTNLTGVSFITSARTYSYQNTGTVSFLSGAAGGVTAVLDTQSVGRVHAGMYVTNGAVFKVLTQVSSVDYTTGTVTFNQTLDGSAAGANASFWGSGTYSHTVPSGWYRCKIYVTGGGGSGGADSSGGDGSDGGGAGGTSIGYWSLVSNVSYTVTVGNGGASVSNGNGNSGGTSSFGALQTATGGAGGLGAGGSGAALGGLGTGGQINLRGGAGFPAQDYSSGDTNPQDGGNGGSSFWGGGASGSYDASDVKAPGVCPGEGGGGGDSDSTSGKGGNGIVVVEYY